MYFLNFANQLLPSFDTKKYIKKAFVHCKNKLKIALSLFSLVGGQCMPI